MSRTKSQERMEVMRAVLFLSATYVSDGFSKPRESNANVFYAAMFFVFLAMDIAELMGK